MPVPDEIAVGHALPELRLGPVTRQHLVEWCAAENDYYPLHYDERVAAGMGLAGTPVQGSMRYALLGRMVERWLAGRGRVASIEVRYTGLNLEGDTLRAGGRVTGLDRAAGRVEIELGLEGADGRPTTIGRARVVFAD